MNEYKITYSAVLLGNQ